MGINTPHTAEGLKEQIEKIARDIEPTLTELSEIATHYESSEQQQQEGAPQYARNFSRIFQGFQQDTFKLIIVGRFSNGKSTLLNALMGRLPDDVMELVKEVSRRMNELAMQEAEDDDDEEDENKNKNQPREQGPLPTSDMPTTPVLTLIDYADTPKVYQQNKSDEQWEEKTLSWYLEEARVKTTREKDQKAFGNVLQFRLELPAPLCQGSITLIDSPGIDNSEEHNQLVDEALTLSDAAIVLFRSDSMLSMEERRFVAKMQSLGIKHYFSLINRWQKRKVDRELRAFAWERLVRDLRGGVPYKEQTVDDFAAYDIYFVDALRALDGRFTDNENQVEASGLTKFEKRLNTFLREERFSVHIERFLTEAERNIIDLQSLLTKRLPMLSIDQTRFEIQLELYKPQLEALRKRSKRIDLLFHTHLRDCQQDLVTDYERLMLSICQQLPVEMDQHRLPSLENLGQQLIANWRRKALLEEAFQMAQSYVQGRVDAWQNAGKEEFGAQYVVSKHLEELLTEVMQEIDSIEKEYESIRFALGGTQIEVGNAQLKSPGWAERIAATAVGLAFGSIDVAIAGGVGGFKPAGRYALGAIAVSVPLAILGAPLLPVVIPAGIIGGMLVNAFWGSRSLEREIKTTVVTIVINGEIQQGVMGLRGAHIKFRPEIDRAVKRVFDEIQSKIEIEVNRYIEEEEWNILDSQRQCSLSLNEREEQIASIDQHLVRLSELHVKLKDGLAASQQG